MQDRDGDNGWTSYNDAQERAAIARYGDPDGGGDTPRCRICGERIAAHQERAEVAIHTPLGDDEVVDSAVVHTECFLMDRDEHEHEGMYLA